MKCGNWLAYILAVLGIGASILATNSLLMPSAAAPGGGAVVRAQSGVMQAYGDSVTLPVEVTEVVGLGAATIVAGFDPMMLTAADCARNPAFDVGLCNIGYDRDGDGVTDAVLFNVISLEGVSTGGGAAVTLVEITWVAGPQAGAGATTVDVAVQTFADTDAQPLAVRSESGQITLTAGSTPTPTPTSVPHSGQNGLYLPFIAERMSSEAGDPEFACSSWCTQGAGPGLRRQWVTADRPVEDWRMVVGMAVHEELVKETATTALAEALLGETVRIEARFGGRWLQACKAVVACEGAGFCVDKQTNPPALKQGAYANE